MLQLLAFQAYNWGYAPFMHPLPIGTLNLCYGQNGSGKTTYLSAISLLLGVTRLPKGKKPVHYIREGENWAFLKAIANNAPDGDGKRPFDRLVPNPQKHNTCTLACLFIYKQGDWRHTYYIVPGDTFEPKTEGRVDSSYTFTQEKYRAALEQVGVRPAAMRLLELGVTGMHDLYESRRLFTFLIELIGSEIIRTTYTQARREWQNAEKILEATLDRYSAQESEVEYIGKIIEEQRQRNKLEQIKIRYQRCVEHARLRSLKNAYEEKKKKYDLLTQQQRQIEQNIQILENKISGLNSEQNEFSEQMQLWVRQRNQAESLWNQHSTALAQLTERARLCAATIANLSNPPIYNVEEVTLLLQQQELVVDDQRQRIRDFENQQTLLIQEAKELHQGQSSLPLEVKTFLQTLREYAIPFHLIADAVSVNDENKKWLKAVEGILGAERFSVIIRESQHRLQAKQLAAQLQYRYWISPPKGTRTRFIPPDSLWKVVQVTNDLVAGWVEDLLLSVHCVETIEQGDRLSEQEGWTTITPNAYRQEPRGGRSVYPRQLVCGQTARQMRLQEITEELGQIEPPLQEAKLHLDDLRQRAATLREHLQRAREQQQLSLKEQEYASILLEQKEAQEKEKELHRTYEHLKNQEQAWGDRRTTLATKEQQLSSDLVHQQTLLRETNINRNALSLENLRHEIEDLEINLPRLSADLQTLFDQEQLSEHEYLQQIQEIDQKLDLFPKREEFYNESVYERQRADVQALGVELEQARERGKEHRDLFEKALQDYCDHLDDLFSQRMAREFRKLCPLAHAQGSLYVLKSDDVNDWSLDVRIGFDGKDRKPLSEAPLSRGQEVLTGLYLVLAALRAVHATPILVLDELVALLDDDNAPKVLSGLKETGVQAFVATPQNRLGSNEEADVLWGFSRKSKNQVEAPAIAVLVRRPLELQWEE